MREGCEIMPAGPLALTRQLIGGCQLPVHTGTFKKEKVYRNVN